jgi:DNA-binding MarR family transcriptional regulator
MRKTETNPMPDEKPHVNPGALMRRLHQVSIALFMEGFRETGLTPLQYTVLRIVEKRPGIDQTSVASHAVLDASTVKDIIARLEGRKLLRRTVGADRRSKTVSLTPAGARTLRLAKPLSRKLQKQLLAPLAEPEQAELLRLMSALLRGHQQPPADPAKRVPWRRFSRTGAARPI